MKAIQLTLDEPLLKAVDRVSKVRRTTRSAFIRSAVKAELLREQIQIQEARHTESYLREPVTKSEFDVWKTEQDWGSR